MATTATEERTGLERSQEKLLHGLRLIGAMIRATWEERGGEGLPAFFTGLSLPELNALHYATDILIEALPVLHKGFGTVMAEKASPENAPVLEYQPLSSLTLAELGVLLEESKDAKTIGFDLREIDPQYGQGRIAHGVVCWTRARQRATIFRGEPGTLLTVGREPDPAARVWPGHTKQPK
jgi:hypothetical protein